MAAVRTATGRTREGPASLSSSLTIGSRLGDPLRRYLRRGFICLAAALTGLTVPAFAATLHVAVAANFTATAQRLADDFHRRTGHDIKLSAGSSGKLYAQIQHGAPFDIFLSADRDRPALLHRQGLAAAPFTYAIGRLALYAPRGTPRALLESGRFTHLAIANPETAPYGAAARATLKYMQLGTALQPRLVIGENIAQAFQFVHSGNAELGFVAWAQVRAARIPATQYWLVPERMHPRLDQQAALLHSSRAPDAAQAFMDYLHSSSAQKIIAADGYDLTRTPAAEHP